jgi:hypothetical protein
MTDSADVGGSSGGKQGDNTGVAAANDSHGECFRYVII